LEASFPSCPIGSVKISRSHSGYIISSLNREAGCLSQLAASWKDVPFLWMQKGSLQSQLFLYPPYSSAKCHLGRLKIYFLTSITKNKFSLEAATLLFSLQVEESD
jgi:hypothetical protein